MKTITQIREEIDDFMKKIGDIRASVNHEARVMSDEERITINDYLDKVEGLETDLALEERTQATRDRVTGSPTTPAVKPDPTKPSVVITRDQQDKRDSFNSLGEQLTAVMRAGSPGGIVDQRLNTRAATGLSEGVPSDGGFLVQTEFSSKILQNVWDNGAVPSRINRIPLSGNVNGLKMNGLDETSRADGSRAGGIQAYWAAEAAEKTGSKPKFRQIEMSLNKLIGLCYATDELLDDATALESVITTGFQNEFDFKITDGVINGVGAGMPLGIMNAGCLVTASKENGQTAATFTYKNVTAMWARLKATSRANSVWLINQDVEPQLQTMSLAVGTGGSAVYLPPGGASASPYGMLFGRPVIPIEHCQTLGTAGDVLLGDFSQYMAIDKGGMKKDVSIHVRFIYDESVFRFVYRFDGQPVLASAITPYNGTATQSHFVVMETRS